MLHEGRVRDVGRGWRARSWQLEKCKAWCLVMSTTHEFKVDLVDCGLLASILTTELKRCYVDRLYVQFRYILSPPARPSTANVRRARPTSTKTAGKCFLMPLSGHCPTCLIGVISRPHHVPRIPTLQARPGYRALRVPSFGGGRISGRLSSTR